MPTGTSLTDGQVRSIFALRAEGEPMKTIADTMEMGLPAVSRVLRRKTYASVRINQTVLDAIAAQGFTPKERGPYKKRVKDTRPPAATLDDLNPDPIDGTKGGGVIQQAAKAVRDVIRDRTTDVGSPKSPLHASREMGPLSTPKQTKADALMNVLSCVKAGNAQRQRAEELRHEAHAMEAAAKQTEDATFVKLTALHELGMSQEFLNALLSESGICTDGRFNFKE